MANMPEAWQAVLNLLAQLRRGEAAEGKAAGGHHLSLYAP